MHRLARILHPFEIDSRALAAMRIALALIMLYDLAWRNANLFEYYIDDGYLPRAVLGIHWYHSLYALSGSASVVRALFALHALLALLLLIGYRTRFATLGCAIMMWSLSGRAPHAAPQRRQPPRLAADLVHLPPPGRSRIS